jgi:hypothetical protein
MAPWPATTTRPAPRPAITTRPRRRRSLGEGGANRDEVARMEAAAIEAGRWLRRTGRVSLPVRSARAARHRH